ncbi:MAG TPA: response regulator [Candidatus Limnocylindria bacterium]|nr:response regulator [Candidatus Limnocylindria bacterium]
MRTDTLGLEKKGEVGCRRILVVDDDAALREIYADLLTGSGYEVRSASDGAAALRILEDGWRPCVVFLDLRMPGMDGWELARRIRSDGRWDGVRIVVIAAHFRIDREAADIGASAWLQKPFDLATLEHHARALCGA